jgi:hypothetical protein
MIEFELTTWKMQGMKALLILLTVCFSLAAFAQSPAPKAAKSKAQQKLQTPTGCKLVGTVKGTKIWAGDCADAAGLRGAVPGAEGAPLSPPEPAGSPIPPEQKQ